MALRLGIAASCLGRLLAELPLNLQRALGLRHAPIPTFAQLGRGTTGSAFTASSLA